MITELLPSRQASRIDDAKDLYFDQLRDLHSMHLQLAESLPRVSDMAADGGLHELVTMQAFRASRNLARVGSLFVRHGQEIGSDVCKAIRGLNEGGEQHLRAVSDVLTRDLMVVAHCGRVFHYGFAAYEMAVTLSAHLGLHADLEQLESPRVEHWAVLRRLGQIRARLCGIRGSRSEPFFPALETAE